MDNLAALADYFQVTLDYLIRGREESATAPETTVVRHYYNSLRYEYKSKRTLFGLPLVHIHYGFGFARAKGIIAIGNVATGLIALGGLSIGLLSLGGVSLGLLLALGGISLGAVSAGGWAIGLMAWGGLALGLLTIGGVSCGVFAVGGVSIASKVAIGGTAAAPLAIGEAVKGAQTFNTPLGPELPAAKAAIAAACQGVPQWVVHFLQYFAEQLL